MADKIYPIRPLKDNLLLLALDEALKEEVTDEGIVIPAAANKSRPGYRKGIVLDKGPGLTIEMDNGNSQIPEWIQPDMIMIYSLAAGWDVKFDGRHYVVVSWRQCEAMVNPGYNVED